MTYDHKPNNVFCSVLFLEVGVSNDKIQDLPGQRDPNLKSKTETLLLFSNTSPRRHNSKVQAQDAMIKKTERETFTNYKNKNWLVLY